MKQIDGNNNHGAAEVPGLSAANGKRIYFVRHGMTEWNKLMRYQGSTDIPLSDRGRDQARRAGLRLRSLSGRASKIICSPLARARETAEIIAKELGVTQIEAWDELREVGFGSWEGLTVPQIIKKDGEDFFNKWRNDQLSYAPEDGEPCRSYFLRAEAAADKLLTKSEDCDIVVGHGAFFRVLLIPLLSQPKSSIFWRARLDNCSISAVDIDNKGRASVAFLNDALHIDADISEIGDIPLQ